MPRTLQLPTSWISKKFEKLRQRTLVTLKLIIIYIYVLYVTLTVDFAAKFASKHYQKKWLHAGYALLYWLPTTPVYISIAIKMNWTQIRTSDKLEKEITDRGNMEKTFKITNTEYRGLKEGRGNSTPLQHLMHFKEGKRKRPGMETPKFFRNEIKDFRVFRF